MPMEYHEDRQLLPPEAQELHRALSSVIEELEAVAWYHQRVVVSKDAELAGIMAHNRDEEIEHAVMGLEWLRRNFPVFDEAMRIYLFSTGSITALEHAEQGGEAAGAEESGSGQAGSDPASLNIGSMRKKGE